MLDTIQHWIAAAGAFFAQYPAMSAILVSDLLSWAPGVVWDNWFAPAGWGPRKVKQISLTITFFVATTVSAVCWHSWAPKDGEVLVVVMSFAFAFSAPLVHLVAGSVLDKYIPWVNLDAKLKKAA